MTLSRIQEWKALGFEWAIYNSAWEDRLSELVDYRKIDGHCNVPALQRKNQLTNWVE
jgi:hypothetical protein